jgi:hypothetical protein
LFRSTIYSRQLAKPPRRGFRTFNHDPYLDAWRLGEVTENLCGLSLGELCAVEINANLDAAISSTRERLHYGPVRQDIGGHIDFMLGAIDQGNINVFQVFRRGVMNDRCGIGGAWRERCEHETSRNAGAHGHLPFLQGGLSRGPLPVV